MREKGYSRLQRVLEASAIPAWIAMTYSLASEIVSDLGIASALVVTLGLAAGFVAADFVSGLVHWLADTWGRSDWPIIGPTIIRGFREHHAEPDAILAHDFIETNGSSSAGSLVLLCLAAVLPFEGHAARLADAAMLSLSTALFATNQIHKWAHCASPPAAVAWLQERGWVLRPADHAVHHAIPFDRNYCITTGWLNPLCQRLEVFTTLERWITACCGAIPRGYAAPPRGGQIRAQ
jgi:plasmanylethanolamine desaturase